MNNLFAEETRDESYYKQKFAELLTDLNMSYDEMDGVNNGIRIRFSGYNMKNLDVLVLFSNDSVQIGCIIANFKNKQEVGLSICNDLNSEDRFLKFYLVDGLMMCSIDSYLSEDVGASRVLSLLSKLNRVVDSKYPMLMRSIYGL
ncbi:MAG: hypothetical protein E7679_03960 [Ruminococcaceae bacterium]|nr:hypothetical protein [Oscillospiraceae bacterium]